MDENNVQSSFELDKINQDGNFKKYSNNEELKDRQRNSLLEGLLAVKRPFSTERFTEEDSSNEDTRENAEWIDKERERSDSNLPNGVTESREFAFASGKGKFPDTNQLIPLDVVDMKRFALARFIQEDPKAADLKWSLFCAACQSYRYDSILRPFPPIFLTEDSVKDIDRLREVTESCPTITILHDQLQDRSKDVSATLINLLYWVLIHLSEPQLKCIPKDEHSKILSLVSSSGVQIAMPSHVMQVVHNNNHPQEQKFSSLSEQHLTKFAFHGSRLDNFYSILNHGLQLSLNKVAAFGPGIYLSSELNISLSYSPVGYGWGGSFLGSQLSIVALCEMIDHPDVKFQDRSRENFSRVVAEGSENGPVPERYFIVQNSDLIRVRYLLVYSNSKTQTNLRQSSTLLDWIKKYKMIAIVVGYILLLLAVGISNSSVVYRYYRRFLRKLGFHIRKV